MNFGAALSLATVTLALGPVNDEPAAGDEPMQEDSWPAAASVGGEPILVAEVDRYVRQSLGTRTATKKAEKVLRAKALEHLVERRRVLAYLEQQELACSAQELNVAWKRFREDLRRRGKELSDYCAAEKIPEPAVRRMLKWRLSWKRFGEKYLTEDNVHRYFERHRRDFDGTRLRVAQILLQPEEGEREEQCVERAAAVRGKIEAGKLSFAQAARQYSQAPTGESGGEVGWISRHKPMPEFFAAAAYKLDEGEMSRPVTSRFGVHLIRCLEVEPGKRTFAEVRGEVKEAAAEYLFHWAASRPAAQIRVKYTGRVPHLLPGSRKLSDE